MNYPQNVSLFLVYLVFCVFSKCKKIVTKWHSSILSYLQFYVYKNKPKYKCLYLICQKIERKITFLVFSLSNCRSDLFFCVCWKLCCLFFMTLQRNADNNFLQFYLLFFPHCCSTFNFLWICTLDNSCSSLCLTK